MNPGMGRPKRATILDVADEAGVSRQTVTRAMNDMAGISPATKQRVLAVAKRLRYRPSRFGRGLVAAPQLTIGLVLDDLANPYYPELAASVVSSAADQGWNVVFADTAHSPNGARGVLKGLADQVDAIIGYVRVPAAEFDEIFGDLPVVVLERNPEPEDRGVIGLDFEPGLRAGVTYLHRGGRRRIVMLDAGSAESPSVRGHQYERVMTELGLEPLRWPGGQTIDDGIAATRRLVEEFPDVDAIVAFNDMVAFGAMKQLQRRRIDIPGQCAILGIDGLAIGSIVTPELSSLALDLREVGRLAVDMAVQMHAGTMPLSGPEVQRTVTHTLLLRESA